MIVQVIEIQYRASGRGAELARLRNAIPRVEPELLPEQEADYALRRYLQDGEGFRLSREREQFRPALKELGVMPVAEGLRILPARPSWAQPSLAHRPAFVKAVGSGCWGQYLRNARFAGDCETQYFEWAINAAHPDAGAAAFTGEPEWTVDLRLDLF